MIIPPYFPTSHYLKRKWWHQLIWLISAIFSLSSFLSIFSTIILLLAQMGLVLSQKFIFFSTTPLSISLYPLSFFFVKQVSFSTLSMISFLTPSAANYSGGYLILIGYFAVMTFAPSYLYRLFLDSLLGRKWQR